MITNEDYENEFSELVSKLVKEPSQEDEKWNPMVAMQMSNRVSELVENDFVSPVVMLNVIQQALINHPSRNQYILFLLRDLFKAKIDKDSLVTSEIMWLVADNYLLEVEINQDVLMNVSKLVTDLFGRNFARSYLNYLHLKHGDNISDLVIPAYYYTGHDLNSLQIIEHNFPMTDANLGLYTQVYRDLSSSIIHKNTSFSDQEIKYLSQFLKKGLHTQAQQIVEYCSIALKNI